MQKKNESCEYFLGSEGRQLHDEGFWKTLLTAFSKRHERFTKTEVSDCILGSGEQLPHCQE